MTNTPSSETSEVCVGALERIPLGEGREFEIEGERIAVFRLRSGGIYATQAICPHRAGPLADGLTDSTSVLCPLHGWKFDLVSGEPMVGDYPIKTFPVRQSAVGDIYIAVGKNIPTST